MLHHASKQSLYYHPLPSLPPPTVLLLRGAGELDMPPLLPKPSDCDKCHGKPNLIIRSDDTEDVVKERFIVYDKQTAPLIAYYTTQKKLQDFNVRKGIDDVPRLVTELGIKD